MTEQEIYDVVMASCEEYLGQKGAKIPRYDTVGYPQRLFILNNLIHNHVLRECGNVERYIALTKALNALPGRQISKNDAHALRIIEWMQSEINGPFPIECAFSDRPLLLIHILAFGDEFTQKMNNYAVKSWCGANLNAITGVFEVVVHIHGGKSENALADEVIEEFYSTGIRFIHSVIPEDILNGIDKDSMYILLGASASIALQYAKKCGAAFHQAFPDTIYSNNYFSELGRLSKLHNNILMPAISVDERAFNIQARGQVNISADDLASLGLNTLHIAEWPCLINNRPSPVSMPLMHKLYYETENNLIIHCPHLNAAFLSAKTVAAIEPRFIHTLDSELDLICRDDDFYIPTAEDNIFLVEVSNQSVRSYDDRYIQISEYPKAMWQVVCARDSLKFFKRGMSVKLNRALRPASHLVIPERYARQEMEGLYQMCLTLDPHRGTKFARSRQHDPV